MTLAEFISIKKSGGTVPVLKREFHKHRIYKPRRQFVIVIPPERQSMRKSHGSGIGNGKDYQKIGDRPRKDPKYKNVRRYGIDFRKHVRLDYSQPFVL